MVKDIEKLLADGATPEQIYQEALRVVEAKNAAAERREQEKKNKREAVVTSMTEYVEFLTGEKVTNFMKEQLIESLDELETFMASAINASKKIKAKSSEDDDKLQAFLKSIGAM